MLRSLGRAELDAMLADHGEVLIHDDLSNHEYRLKRRRGRHLHRGPRRTPHPALIPGSRPADLP